MKPILLISFYIFGGIAIADDLPWNDPSCDFKKLDLKLTPNALVEQYIKRDSEGQFLEQNDWKDQATICPGHAPGSDTSTVIANYQIKDLTVTYQVVGHLDAVNFDKTQATEVVTIKVQKTPFGYKIIDSSIINQHISTEAAIKLASSNKLAKKHIDALNALRK